MTNIMVSIGIWDSLYDYAIERCQRLPDLKEQQWMEGRQHTSGAYHSVEAWLWESAEFIVA